MQLETVLFVRGGCYILWLLYMATFRTKDLIDLGRAAEEQKKARAERWSGAANTGVSFVKWWFGK
jgi:hypothetical protein